MYLIVYCHFALILLFNCGFCQHMPGSTQTEFSNHLISYTEGDEFKANINVKGIQEGVKDVVLWFEAIGGIGKVQQSLIVEKATDMPVYILKTLKDDDGTFYIKLMKGNDAVCDMKQVITVRKGTRITETNTSCPNNRCEVNVTVDFKNLCNKSANSDFLENLKDYESKTAKVSKKENTIINDRALTYKSPLEQYPTEQANSDFLEKLKDESKTAKVSKKENTIINDRALTYKSPLEQYPTEQANSDFLEKLKDESKTAKVSKKENTIINDRALTYKSPLEQYPTEQGAAGSNIIVQSLEAEHERLMGVPNITRYYKIGNILQVTCNGSMPNNITWVTDSNKKIQFQKIPPCFRQHCILEMQLELFDDGIYITCKKDKKVSKTLVLKLNDTRSRLQQTSTEDICYYSDNEQLNFECQHKSPGNIISKLIPERSVTYNQAVHHFNLSKSQTGARLVCVNYNNNDKGTFFKTTRSIDNYILYLSKEQGNEKTTKWILIIAPVVGSCILLTAVVVLLFKYKIRTEKPAHEVDTYACVNRVEYADLEMLQSNSRRNNIQADDRTPYAQVIGVLTPKK